MGVRACRRLIQQSAATTWTTAKPPSGQRSANRRMASCDGDCTFGCQDQSGIGRGARGFGRGLRRRRERIGGRNRQRGGSFCLHFAWKSAKGRTGPRSRDAAPFAALPALRALPSQSSRPIAASTSNEGHRTPTPPDLSSICSKLSPIGPDETRKIAPPNDPVLRAGTNVCHPELTTGPGMERRSFSILSHGWRGYPSMDSIIRWRKTALPLPAVRASTGGAQMARNARGPDGRGRSRSANPVSRWTSRAGTSAHPVSTPVRPWKRSFRHRPCSPANQKTAGTAAKMHLCGSRRSLRHKKATAPPWLLAPGEPWPSTNLDDGAFACR